MTHVFISYVRENQQQVDKLKEELRSAGVEVWLDREQILPGQRWRSAIRQAIEGGMFFIACFSHEYTGRTATYMNEEITVAIEVLRSRSTNGTWFIPVLLSECSIPDREIGAGETLRDFQWVNLHNNWSDGIKRILKAMSVPIEAGNDKSLPENTRMGMGFYATHIQAELLRQRENAEHVYDRTPDTVRFWATLGLEGGASYHLRHEPSRAYILSKLLSLLTKEVVIPNEDINLVREMDGVILLSALTLRPLLEALVLADQVSMQMAIIDKQLPFVIRGGISFGKAKIISHSAIGFALDQLIRILYARTSEVSWFLTETAYQQDQDVVHEYSEFLAVSEVKILSDNSDKNVIAPVHYRELRIDREEFAQFGRSFGAWREFFSPARKLDELTVSEARRVLARVGGNKRKAAQLLGISTLTLYKLVSRPK